MAGRLHHSDMSVPGLERKVETRARGSGALPRVRLWIRTDRCPVTVLTCHISVKARSTFILPCIKVTQVHVFLASWTVSCVMSWSPSLARA